jgi:hypothetical protein
MSLLDLHTDDTLQALPRMVAPKLPEAKFNAFALDLTRGPQDMAVVKGGRALGGAVLTASAEVMASASELAYAPFKRKSVDTGADAMRNDFADALRERGREFAPDPETASTAEQILYGFGRAASKVVAGALAAGPVGVLAAGLEEANTVSVELADKGVDSDTRKRAAAVQGAGLALAALPVLGQTLPQTAALYLAGGPGGFVAQQALTRQILNEGGYEQMGQQYDPLDPVGLAVASLVPLPFVAAGVRGQRAARAAQAELEFQAAPLPSEPTPVAAAVQAYPTQVVDAARVMLSVEKRAASNRAGTTLRAADQHEAAMTRAEELMSRGEPVVVADLVPPRRIEGLADFMARVKVAPEAMPPEVRGNFLGWLRDAGGIDMALKNDITGEANAIRSNPAGIFRKGGRNTDDLALQAWEQGYLRDPNDSRGLVELVQQAVRGERVLNLSEQGDLAARNARGADIDQRLQAVEQRLQLLGVDTTPARGNLAVLEAYAREREPDLLAAALYEVRRIDLPNEVDELDFRAAQVAGDIRDSGRTLAEYEAEIGPLSTVMRRLVGERLEAQPAAAATPPRGQPRDLQTELIALRKQDAVLKKLLECLNG